MTDDLILAEQLFLLSHREDNTHRYPGLSSQSSSPDFMLQAALIIELIERGQVAVVPSRGPLGGEKFVLERSGFTSAGNATLDALLDRIALPKNENKSLRSWVTASSVRAYISDDLAARGVVTRHSERVSRFKEVEHVVPTDRRAVAALREQFYGVFLHDREPGPREFLTAALLVDGDAWEYFEPTKGTPGMAHFFERLRDISDRYRPSIITRATSRTPPARPDDGGITRVLEALGRATAPSA
jgi:hypothetical protein